MIDPVAWNAARGYEPEQVRQIQRVVSVHPSGVWDVVTVAAIERWQAEHGLEVDGLVGRRTWAAIRAAVAEPVVLLPRHPLPASTWRWGYEHLPMRWREQDPEWLAATEGMSRVTRAHMRLLTGWTPGQDTFSRGPDSWISLDLYSIGIAHWWSDTAPILLARIATEEPEIACEAWGRYAAEEMTDPRWLRRRHPPRRGAGPHHESLDWLLAGWHWCASRPEVVDIQMEQWLTSYPVTAEVVMEERGWVEERTLVALARVANSRGAGGLRSLVRRAGAGTEREVVDRIYLRHDLYDHPRRLEVLDQLGL